MLPEAEHFLVLTPAIDGADGISELSRQTVRALANAAGADRVEVWALAGEAPHDLTSDWPRAFRTAGGKRSRIVGWALGRAAGRLDNLTVVVLHAHLAPLAHVLAGRGARVVALLVGVEVWRPLRPRERRALEHADRLIAISSTTATRFIAANPAFANSPIAVCPLGIGPERAVEPEPGSQGHEGFALIVARLAADERYKGHEQLIEVWPSVRVAVPNARLVVAGDGDDKARLEQLVVSQGLGDAISFTGRVSDDTLASLYARSACFVMPSTREGFGLVYLEAMRAGKPCIAVHGAADEIIRDGIDGIVVEEDSPSRLAAAIISLLSDRELAGRMGAAAAARVAAGFTEQHFAGRFLGILAERAVSA